MAILNFFRIYSIACMIVWILLALPWMDQFIGTHWISSLDYTAFKTYLGTFTGKQGDYYFMTVFVSIIGVKGFFLVKRMADVLTNDTLAVGMTGIWGARKDFH